MIIDKKQLADRHGYYQIGDRKTYIKTELMDWDNQLHQTWNWNYNDDFFGQADWAKEPKEDIDELYRQRALELRATHDYLILYYSGGHDSAQMLYAFLENDIPIDEVCVYYSKYDTISNQFKELSSLTWDKLKWLKLKYPKLNVRVIDYGDMYKNWKDIITKYGYGDNLFDVFGSMLSVNRIIADEFYLTIPDWTKLLEQGKKVAWLFGSDKPMLRYLDGKWIFNFHDGLIHARGTPLRQSFDDGTIGAYELFYWAPTDACQKIIRKQSHLIKKKYDAQAKVDFSKINGVKGFKPGYGWELDTMSSGFVQTIYPRLFKYDEIYFIEKNKQYIFGNRDQWYFNSNHDSAKEHYDMYLSLKSNLYSHYRTWMNDPGNIDNGLKNCISPDYII
jgi:hypothetical protein